MAVYCRVVEPPRPDEVLALGPEVSKEDERSMLGR